jgi:hypothetical protein
MFYEIEIQVSKDGAESKGMYSYDSRDKAVAVYHQKMASGMQNANLATVLNMVINEHGGTEVREFWMAPVEPEPEPEVEA